MTTIVAAIHDRTLHHLPVPADVTIRLAAGQVLRATRRLLTGGSTTVRSG
jgi:hypothetical protein